MRVQKVNGGILREKGFQQVRHYLGTHLLKEDCELAAGFVSNSAKVITTIAINRPLISLLCSIEFLFAGFVVA